MFMPPVLPLRRDNVEDVAPNIAVIDITDVNGNRAQPPEEEVKRSECNFVPCLDRLKISRYGRMSKPPRQPGR